MNNKRFYTFNIIIYDERSDIIENLYLYSSNYIYALHNNDYDDNGELKKRHYHVIIRFDNARTIHSLATMLDINENLIEPTKNLNSSLKYLIHFNSIDKFNYDTTIVKGTEKMLVKFNNAIYVEQEEEEKIQSIFSYINSINRYIYYKELLNFVIDSKQLKFFRQYHSIIIRLLDEHNNQFIDIHYYKN